MSGDARVRLVNRPTEDRLRNGTRLDASIYIEDALASSAIDALRERGHDLGCAHGLT